MPAAQSFIQILGTYLATLFIFLAACFSKIKNLIEAEINNGSKDYDLEYIRCHVSKLTS